jgi:aminopeptidase-like protein
MRAIIDELFPLCRSITGEGTRQTLRLLKQRVPLEIREVPSGTPVLDWTVPDEWNIRDGYIATTRGDRVVDFRQHNLHVVNYSVPVRERVTREALAKHVHWLDEHPDWIPYRTSYYNRNWGFCLTKRQWENMTDAAYDVCIDSALSPGSLTYGEFLVAGESTEEFVFTTHICHPSLANDNLSGIAVATELATRLAKRRSHYSYRFLFIPGTIGSLTWLATNRERWPVIRGGMSLVCLGDARHLTYKASVHGNAMIDRAARLVLGARGRGDQVIEFFPFGYDERQFNSPGVRIPFGSLMRGQHGQFPEYHTSADNLEFISEAQLSDAADACEAICAALDADRCFKNLAPFGEPQLGRRGIYRAVGGTSDLGDLSTAMLWVLQLCDGQRSQNEIVERSSLPKEVIERAMELLRAHDLIG